jgi:NADH-quinone oxidoreductase subunit H
VVLFFGPLVTLGPQLIFGVLVYLLIVALICVIRNTNPRLRIDQILKFFWGPWTVLALISLILAAAGH